MNRPDALSRAYALVLPELEALGYRAHVMPSYLDERFTVRVGRMPTARVLHDGSWRRDDGVDGPDPDALVDAYRDDRARQVRHNLDADDMRGIARDVLELDMGQRVGCITNVTPAGGDAWDVEYRGMNGGHERVILEHPRQTARKAMLRLITS